MKRVVLALMSLLIAGRALAQQQVTAEVPFASPAPLVTVTPDPNDARAAVCSAATLPDFGAYVVRPGDHLADLIAGQTLVTVTQIAALNCIDDPDALPVGAVIWLPKLSSAESAATPEATAESATTPEVSTTAEAAQISSFNASAASISNTDTVTFSWSASGSSAYFYPCADDHCVRPTDAPPVPLKGSVSFNGFQAAGSYRYRLDVDGTGGAVVRDASVAVTCAQTWLGGVGASPLCPQDPARTIYAVAQPFEHGIMIWFSDVKQIFVMTDDGQVRVYVDQYVEGQPDPGEKAPSGRFTPTRGFGLLWETLGGANSPLGWALAHEAGYDSARQAAGNSSYTTYIQGANKAVYAVTQLPGNAVGYWAQVAG